MPLAYHHHMAAVIETEHELDLLHERIRRGASPLLFDAGHMAFAGGDVLRVIDKHHAPHQPRPHQGRARGGDRRPRPHARELPRRGGQGRLHRAGRRLARLRGRSSKRLRRARLRGLVRGRGRAGPARSRRRSRWRRSGHEELLRVMAAAGYEVAADEPHGRQDLRRHRRHAGPRRRHRPAPRRGRRGRPRHLRAQRGQGRRRGGRPSSATPACRSTSSAADLASVDDCRAVIAEADERLRPGRRAGQRRRPDRPRHHPRHRARNSSTGCSRSTSARPFFLMQEAIRLHDPRRRSRARIVNIGSMSAHAGQPFIAPYCASKGALATLTRNTAFAVMRNRIRVNQLDIGWMASGQRGPRPARADGRRRGLARARPTPGQPFGRLVDPEEVARAVAFLASDESGLMTGAMIHFDQSVWGAYPGRRRCQRGR